MSEEGQLWFVLHCHSDDSHVLLEAKYVMYDDDTVHNGDEVHFEYPGLKDLLVGEIKGFSVDYDKIKNLQDKLNAETKPKRDTSYHAGNPRKAKEKCLKGLKSRSARSSSGSQGKRKGAATAESRSSRKTPAPAVNSSKKKSDLHEKDDCPNAKGSCEPKEKPLSKLLNAKSIYSDSDSDDKEDTVAINQSSQVEEDASVVSGGERDPSGEITDENDSDSSDSDLNEVEKRALEKLLKKKKVKEMKDLYAIGSKSKRSGADSGIPSKILVLQSHEKCDLKEPVQIKLNKLSPTFCSGPEENTGQGKIVQNIDPEPQLPKPYSSSSPSGSGVMGTKPKSTQVNITKAVKKPKTQVSPTLPAYASGLSNSLRAKLIKMKARKVQQQQPKEYTGEYFRVKLPDREQAVKISPDYDVYITKKDFRTVKNCITSSAIVRCLVTKVFTDDALAACSVSGKLPSNGDEIRPALHQDGVDAIIDFAKKRADKKKWKEPDESTLKQRMVNRICELRQAALLKVLAAELTTPQPTNNPSGDDEGSASRGDDSVLGEESASDEAHYLTEQLGNGEG